MMKGGKALKTLCLIASLFPLLGLSNLEYQNNHFITPFRNSLLNRTEQFTFHTNKNIIVKSIHTKKTVMLNVVLMKQNPELKYGCEVTSLAMMLNYAGVKVDKMELFRTIQKDNDPLIRSASGDILKWGNPNDGFVGDMTGIKPGYAVFDQPIASLVNKYLPNRAFNLTNQPFESLLQHVSDGHPIVVWTTGDFQMPDRWESWYHGTQLIKTPLDLHAVVLVGYDQNNVFVNDPLSGKKQYKINKIQFIHSWNALNCRAVSYIGG